MFIRGGRLGLAVLTLVGTLTGATMLLGQNVAGATTSGGTLYVSTTGSDTGTCRLATHPCLTIGYTITQSNPNSTISLAPGTYPEQVSISKSLTIVGVASQTSIAPTSLSPVDTDPNHSSTPYPIVDVTSGATLTLKNLTIDGSGAQSTFNSCGQDPIGVYFHNAFGDLKNVTVSNIAETSPTDGSLFGCQVGIGVYVASDTGSSNVILQSDTITGYQKDGVACRDANTRCYVNDSTVTGVGPSPYQGANGIEIYGAAIGSVIGNTVTANSYTAGGAGNQATGLLLLDDGILTVTGNTLSGNDINAYLGSDGSGPTESGWTFSQNTVTGATDGVTGERVGVRKRCRRRRSCEPRRDDLGEQREGLCRRRHRADRRQPSHRVRQQDQPQRRRRHLRRGSRWRLGRSRCYDEYHHHRLGERFEGQRR